MTHDKQKSGQLLDNGGSGSSVARRKVLLGGLGLMGGAAAGVLGMTPAVSAASNLPPNIPEWTRVLGSGVLTNPYGQPSPFESNVQRRTVDWLTPDRVASISFTPLADLKGIITPSGLVLSVTTRVSLRLTPINIV